MATITASLERSLQNCSLNQTTTTTTTSSSRSRKGGVRSSSSVSSNQRRHRHHDDGHHHPHPSVSQSNASSSDDNSAFVDLNSHLSLPYHWEQCLDLKTGEIYYINWSNGMKAKEDPRTTSAAAPGVGDSYYSEEDEQEEEEENDSSSIHNNGNNNGYNSEGDGEGYSTCSSTSTRESFRSIKTTHVFYDDDQDADDDDQGHELSSDSILVVAGCKSCLMYYMLPKHALDCPKCSGQLLHFPANHKPS